MVPTPPVWNHCQENVFRVIKSLDLQRYANIYVQILYTIPLLLLVVD